MSMQTNKAGRRWEDIVGYSIEDLKKHLINHPKWKKGMTLDNYGVWEIDHVKPRSKFKFTSDRVVKQCWSLQNLQPLWYDENAIKSDSYCEEEMKDHEELLNNII